ncbi:MAG: hypothetical protein EF806_04300 [Candidatus Methanoliparum thermophilum]|uniref:Sodium:glutamate symporter n=1 Tax=Methanoliparum thermophilum TaxID=2491083 RepID=A0A520KS36_METT2|nr:hypothetical protein [Candidatus Methanoliparum sp. LAM-1]RZN64567.1 MAG: hypothetical protein EF806_04300 [Candidatus Methanoliparum thermophilum]BDC35834.1 hypothetical protein MTLP_05160 [Candidatus Methanoliparum sp. LAM-1]
MAISNISGDIVLWDFIFASLLLILGTILRARIKLFQKWLIPNAIISGVIGLILSNGLLYIPFSENMVFYPYHLLNLCYCSILLSAVKISWKEFKTSGLSTGLCISFTQAMQAAFGVGLALMRVVDPDFKSPSLLDFIMGSPLILIVQFIIALGGLVIYIDPFAIWTRVLYFLILIVMCIVIWLIGPAFGLWKKYKPFWRLWPKD